eukprot:9369664-Alexandrium_andersonii.AAC.1
MPSGAERGLSVQRAALRPKGPFLSRKSSKRCGVCTVRQHPYAPAHIPSLSSLVKVGPGLNIQPG